MVSFPVRDVDAVEVSLRGTDIQWPGNIKFVCVNNVVTHLKEKHVNCNINIIRDQCDVIRATLLFTKVDSEYIVSS